MAEIFEKVDSYDREIEEWPQYVERLGHVFAANAIDTEVRKRSIFHSVIGPTPYKLLRGRVTAIAWAPTQFL